MPPAAESRQGGPRIRPGSARLAQSAPVRARVARVATWGSRLPAWPTRRFRRTWPPRNRTSTRASYASLKLLKMACCSHPHQQRSVARNVCLLAPLRRPNPIATPGAIMGRFANSESCAMPVFAARSYQ